MSRKEIDELVSDIYDGKVPEELPSIIDTFIKRKSAICPLELTISDVVSATIICDLFTGLRSNLAKESASEVDEEERELMKELEDE